MSAEAWPWLALAGLGAFHGLNPAMGWLFAVALGMHRQSFASVLWALPPIAVGHSASVALVALAAVAAGFLVDARLVQTLAGCALVAWAGYHWAWGHRHRVRVGMQTGMTGLVIWSFLMATAHGAGLMVLPALMPLCIALPSPSSGTAAAAAVAAHAVSMLAVTGIVAVIVYRWLGLAVLRSAWINLDVLWTVALAGTGVLLAATA